jgi:hypothetical protein
MFMGLSTRCIRLTTIGMGEQEVVRGATIGGWDKEDEGSPEQF